MKTPKNLTKKEQKRKHYLKYREREIEKERKRYYEHREDRLAKAKPSPNHNDNVKRYYRKNKDKTNAEQQARRKIEIPEGQICQRCNLNLAIQRHHPDYNNPLEVLFLCSACHGEVHRKPLDTQTLSDKIEDDSFGIWLRVKDVREFVRRLKESFISGDENYLLNPIEKIDKLAGEKLTK